MSGKEELIPALTDQLPDKSTCSLTKPNSLIDGCINEMKSVATDDGYAIVGTAIAAGAGLKAYFKKHNVVMEGAKALGLEGIAACGAGMINTAIKNCDETDPTKLNLPSISDNKITEPIIPTTTPLTSDMFESKIPTSSPLSTGTESTISSLTPLPSSSVEPSISSLPSLSNSSVGSTTHNFVPVPVLDNPIIPPIAPVPTLDPLPSFTTDSSLLGAGLDHQPH